MKKSVQLLRFILFFSAFLTCVNTAIAAEKLTIYTGQSPAFIEKIKVAFEKKNPDISLEFKRMGANDLINRLQTDKDFDRTSVDILWTSEIADYYDLSNQGLLEPLSPKEIYLLANPLPETAAHFIVTRLIAMGMAYNTQKIKNPPREWASLLTPPFAQKIGMTEPASFSPGFITLSAFVNEFGWDYIEGLASHGLKLEKSNDELLNKIAKGDLSGGIVSDLISQEKSLSGAPLALVFPKESVFVPLQIAILKSSKNKKNAHRFVDFSISKEAQEILRASGGVAMRKDVALPERFRAFESINKISERMMRMNYGKMVNARSATLRRFAEIYKKYNPEVIRTTPKKGAAPI